MSLLTKHIENAHEKSTNMRSRLSCNKCGFKTTTNAVLKTHIESKHRQKVVKPSKRKSCEFCDKRFNKDSNLKEHMVKQHKANDKISKSNKFN